MHLDDALGGQNLARHGDAHDAFHLDSEDIPTIVVSLFLTRQIGQNIILGDHLAVAHPDHLRHTVGVAIDAGAAEVVLPLVLDDVGESQPFTPRQTSVDSGKLASLALVLDSSQIVVVAADTTDEGGNLGDGGATLQHLRGSGGGHADKLTPQGQQLVQHGDGSIVRDDAEAGAGHGGSSGVAHAFKYSDRNTIVNGYFINYYPGDNGEIYLLTWIGFMIATIDLLNKKSY